MFEDTCITTSDDPRFSLFIFTISRNGAFSIWCTLTVLIGATYTALKCLIWTYELIVHDNAIIGGLHHRNFANATRLSPILHNPAEFSPYQRSAK